MYLDLRYPSTKDCQLPCTRMKVMLYAMSKVEDTMRNTSSVNFVLKSKVEMSEEVLHQTLTLLLAEIGGFLGLILGVSLLDLRNLFPTSIFNRT